MANLPGPRVEAAMRDSNGDALDFTVPAQVTDALASTADLTAATISQSTSGEKTIVSAVASQTVRVHAMRLHAVAAVTLTVKDGASGTTLETIVLAAAEKFSLGFRNRPHYITTAGNAFIIELSTNAQIYGRIEYVQSA